MNKKKETPEETIQRLKKKIAQLEDEKQSLTKSLEDLDEEFTRYTEFN